MSWLFPFVAFCVAFAVIALKLQKRWVWAIDTPNERSLHSAAVPRTGGLGVMAGVACASVAAFLMQQNWPAIEFVLAAALCTISFLDDKNGLPVMARLAAHTVAAAAYVGWLAYAGHLTWWPLLLLAIPAIIAMTNFFNFMDGANGLASGMAIAGFGSYAIAAASIDPAFASLCWALAAAAAGFLYFNFNGRIFLGDSGSVPLGFLAATLGISGWTKNLWPFWFPLIIFAPFIVDAGVTLLRRLLRREKFWQPHREHYYQRLVRMGWTHPQVACAEYALMTICAGTALVAQHQSAPVLWLAFAAIALLFIMIGTAIDFRWRHFQSRQ